MKAFGGKITSSPCNFLSLSQYLYEKWVSCYSTTHVLLVLADTDKDVYKPNKRLDAPFIL